MPMALAIIPAIMYFLNPNTLQMATAKGAESWNSVPGNRPGNLNAPATVINAASNAISALQVTLFTKIEHLPLYVNYILKFG